MIKGKKAKIEKPEMLIIIIYYLFIYGGVNG